MDLTDTEKVELFCGVTVHGLDRINERFDGRVDELIPIIISHLKLIKLHNIVGPSVYKNGGINTVIEAVDGVTTLVTAYYTVKGDKEQAKHRRRKRKTKFNEKTKRIKYEKI